MLFLFTPLFIAIGLLMGGIGLAMSQDKIKPNTMAGLRTEKTLSDPAVWYNANRHAGKWLVGVGFLVLFAATVTLFYPIFRDNFVLYASVNAVVLLAGVLTAASVSVAYSETL